MYEQDSQRCILTVHYVKQEEPDEPLAAMDIDQGAPPNSSCPFLYLHIIIFFTVGSSQPFGDGPEAVMGSEPWASAMRTPPFDSFAQPADQTGDSSMISPGTISAIMELSFGSDDSVGCRGDV